jgi:glycosyltransferase involved in cell wall biosynthesis
MSKAPLVSVLMPVYQAEKTVVPAVESILNSTLREIELICVDDGSTDGTSRHLERLAASDSRVRLFRREHAGIVDALNFGLLSCKAPLIARMDADDLSLPDRLERQYRFMLERPDVDVVSCLVSIERTDGMPLAMGMARYEKWVNSLITEEEIARERFVESPVVHPTVMARRDCFKDGYRNGDLPEDYDLWLRLLGRGHKFSKINTVLYRWTERPDRATWTDTRYRAESFLNTKLRHLLNGPLKGESTAIVWGAGPNGKRWLKALSTVGVAVPYVIELDPRKLGKWIHGALAILPEALSTHRQGEVILSAIGAPGGRHVVRSWLLEQGYKESVDYWMVC